MGAQQQKAQAYTREKAWKLDFQLSQKLDLEKEVKVTITQEDLFLKLAFSINIFAL